MEISQNHPLKPFYPPDARLLMLGSFPPNMKRWSMDFYYPNFQNDMWRIFGLVFFGDAQYFVFENQKIFDKQKIQSFLVSAAIAMYDTAESVVRLRGDSSDKFLQVTGAIDLSTTFVNLPQCGAIAATGEKAAKIIAAQLNVETPALGAFVDVEFCGRNIRFFRMPSSSRAYPKPFAPKANAYAEMFKSAGIACGRDFPLVLCKSAQTE